MENGKQNIGHNNPPVDNAVNNFAEKIGILIKDVHAKIRTLHGKRVTEKSEADYLATLQAAERAFRDIENEREICKRPFIDVGRDIDKLAREKRVEAKNIIAPYRQRLLDFRQKEAQKRAEEARKEAERRRDEEARARAEAEKIQKPKDDEVHDPIAAQIDAATKAAETEIAEIDAEKAEAETEKGKGQRRIVERIEVVDISQVPAEFLTLNETKAKKYLLDADTPDEIKGLLVKFGLTQERL